MSPLIRASDLLGILCIAALVTPTTARADGCFVWKNRGIDIVEPEQKAFIFYDQGREDLVVSVKFEGAPEDFGWIVPLPSAPEMFPEDSLLFTVLSQATQRRQYVRSQRGEQIHQTLGMEVVSSQRVGIYETKVVEATAGKDLQDWLAANGYQLPSGAGRVLDRYVRDGWVFATLKIGRDAVDSTTAGRLRSGTIPPIRFRFACAEPVFPLEISSLMAGGSDVLLYLLRRDVTVPLAPKPESWANQISSQPGGNHWIYQYEQDRRTARFLPQYEEPFYLTKHRLHLDPAEMQDVRFGPYDPTRGLRSSSEAERVEAIAYLGRFKPPGALDLVLTRLRDNPARAETFSLLWALGELGGPEAERTLLAHAEAADPEIRIETVEALGRMRSHAALPCLIRGLESGPAAESSEQVAALRSYQMACFEWLLALGDSTCLGELRRMAEKHAGADQWTELSRSSRPYWMDEPGGSDHRVNLLSVAALTACGDAEARREILRAIVSGGQETTAPEALASAATQRGSDNDFPSGFWTGLAARRLPTWRANWPSLSLAYSLFETAPALRTSLLEEAASDSGLPRTGMIVLLANVDTLRAPARDRLMQLWRESIREPWQTIDVRVESHQRSHPVTLRYNHDACAIAYAFSRHKSVVELERLWLTRPEDDPVLEGEIIFAMTETHDPRFLPIVLDYVRRVWSEAARSPEFEWYIAESMQAGRGLSSLYFLTNAPFDVDYRVRSTWRYLTRYPPDSEFEESLIVDRSLPPYLRLAALGEANFYAESRWKLLPIARAELDTLRLRGAGKGGFAAQIADTLSRRLERTARFVNERQQGNDPSP